MKKLIYLIVLTLILGLVLTGCFLSDVGQVPTNEQSGIAYLTKHTEGDPFTTELIADGGDETSAIDVGDVLVWNDGDILYVQYVVTAPWCLTETHLHVATSLEGIPQKKGNPPPGKFEYSMDHDPAITEYTYTIPLTWDTCTKLFIAAHAVVQKTTIITAAPYYASVVIDYSQGLTKGGALVRWQRSTPEQGLAFETGQNEFNFFSLGFGGWIIVEFDCPIQNGEGNDVKIIEDTWGGGYPLETADIFASKDGTNWTYLGEADNTNQVGIHTISEFDLGILNWAKYIKIEDTCDPTPHNDAADGYDLNAVESLQDCVEIQEETAWAAGSDFPGKNWATYFKYEVQYEAELILENKDSNWIIISGDGIQGTLEYNLAGPTFNFRFSAEGLDASTNYSLIYYADPWPGDGVTHSTGALIATMTTESDGKICISRSVELGTDLPNSDDYNYSSPCECDPCPGAKIWLVPSNHYSTTTPGDQGYMTGWDPADYLFEGNSILYDDTDI